MKKFLYIITAIAVSFTACKQQNTDFRLDGDCNIVALTLDEQYSGTIDLKAKTVVVGIPETYNEQQMIVSRLDLSVGATADIKVGDRLNLLAPCNLRVTNGNVFQDFTVSVKHDEARILSFVINDHAGIINESLHTITVQVPQGSDLAHLTPVITVTDGATVTPASGLVQDFTRPVNYTVTCHSASATYTVTVKEMGAPHALYIGLAATQQQLNIEEQTACTWLLSTVEQAAYASFSDLAAGNINLSQCKVIWWHLHKDGGIDGKGQFENNAADALLAQDALTAYYKAGGSFLLTRYATYLPAYIGEKDCVPNNCWGQNEDNAETVSEPWSFGISGHTEHPVWQDLLMKGDEPERVFTCDKGYRITNSTAQYHIGTDWGGYADDNEWRTKTGAIDIAHGDKAIVAWEYPRTAEHGAIICIGSGCYDWYTIAESVTDYYHANVAKITQNAINYLSE